MFCLNFVSTSNLGPVCPGPDLFTSGLFLRLKLGLPVGLAGAAGPVRPQAGLTQSGNPDFNTQKEVLGMRVVLTVGDERTELLG
jgi:hypothetical protein